MENTDKRPIILLVDDSLDFLEIMSMRLSSDGFEVVKANGGEEALEKLKDLRPDLVVLDLEMPGMNGVEVLMKIKTNPELKDLKAVFLTNYGEPQEKTADIDKKFALEVGALCYLKKTDDMDHIVKEIRKHV